ncbi:MAG: hypothetical protein HY036_01945 [Nitrospirae bacterium]|nr:hypothetical protein [Nitrospirota bacterium]MBI3351319.1 hypothetical protein [Nitrospirota bacterium]
MRLFPSYFNILAVQTGTVLNFRNSDPLLHNFHFSVDNRSLFNLAVAPFSNLIKRPLNQAGLVHAKCDIHNFMEGFILVVDTPYFTLTDDEGGFRLSDVPPGKYTLSIWHEAFKKIEKEIEVKPNAALQLSFGVI